jgi:hypothetical protein
MEFLSGESLRGKFFLAYASALLFHLGRCRMGMFWLFMALVIVLMVGNALTLLRTAKPPKIPESAKPKPYRDDEEGGW